MQAESQGIVRIRRQRGQGLRLQPEESVSGAPRGRWFRPDLSRGFPRSGGRQASARRRGDGSRKITPGREKMPAKPGDVAGRVVYVCLRRRMRTLGWLDPGRSGETPQGGRQIRRERRGRPAGTARSHERDVPVEGVRLRVSPGGWSWRRDRTTGGNRSGWRRLRPRPPGTATEPDVTKVGSGGSAGRISAGGNSEGVRATTRKGHGFRSFSWNRRQTRRGGPERVPDRRRTKPGRGIRPTEPPCPPGGRREEAAGCDWREPREGDGDGRSSLGVSLVSWIGRPVAPHCGAGADIRSAMVEVSEGRRIAHHTGCRPGTLGGTWDIQLVCWEPTNRSPDSFDPTGA